MSQKQTTRRVFTFVLVVAMSLALVGATGTVAADDERDCAPFCSTGPTFPDDPTTSQLDDPFAVTMSDGVLASIDDDPCWEDDVWDCGGTGPTNPN